MNYIYYNYKLFNEKMKCESINQPFKTFYSMALETKSFRSCINEYKYKYQQNSHEKQNNGG